MLLALCLAVRPIYADSGVSPPDSRCQEDRFLGLITIRCSSKTLTVTGKPGDSRKVEYEVPLGDPPVSGWPVVFIYQPTSAKVKFVRGNSPGLNSFNEIRLIRELLNHGFAVIAPPARNSLTAWDTNDLGTATSYVDSHDYVFLSALFAKVSASNLWVADASTGRFAGIDPGEMYATGLSSGGYNSSRMAVSFAGMFRGLAIESASYATCSGSPCRLPARMPPDHPPTLFLHGGNDRIVQLETMEPYEEALRAQGTPTRKVIQADAGHQWIDAAPHEVVDWFIGHP
ncbi:MAG: extracellular medium-chain-length polyhydroxyalkanoate depolymerase [Panacagrimonas sp.]